MVATLNINQFAPTPVVGQITLNTPAGNTISGMVSLSQATALNAGDRVKLDTPAGVKFPSFIAAAYNEAAIGTLEYDIKGGSKATGEPCQVAVSIGQVMWKQAGAASIAAGATVGLDSSSNVITYASGPKYGIALDPAAAGDIFRVILVEPLV